MKFPVASLTFAAMLIVSPGFARGDCNHPRNVVEDDRCLLAQFSCEYAFLGGDRAADRKLDGVYRRDMGETLAAWQDGLKDPDSPDQADQYKFYLADYKSAARDSQRKWLKFRDSYATLAGALYQDRAKVPDPASSAKLALTKLRIADRRSNNAGIDPQYAR